MKLQHRLLPSTFSLVHPIISESKPQGDTQTRPDQANPSPGGLTTGLFPDFWPLCLLVFQVRVRIQRRNMTTPPSISQREETCFMFLWESTEKIEVEFS